MGYADGKTWKPTLPALVQALQKSGIRNPHVLKASDRHLVLSAEKSGAALLGFNLTSDTLTPFLAKTLGGEWGKEGYMVPLVVKVSFDEADRLLAMNEMMMATVLMPSTRAAGVNLPIRVDLLQGPGFLATLWRRVQGEPLATSIEMTAAQDRMTASDWQQLARVVHAGDELHALGGSEEEISAALPGLHPWPDAWLLDRLYSNLKQAVERGFLTQAQSRTLALMHGRSPERRFQHHDLGPWNLLREEKTGGLVLLDPEFGGWRHQLYDAVYLLLQWTLNKPYPAGARAWWAALVAEFGEDRLSWMMTKEARPAVIYRLAATMKELDDSPATQARVRALVEAMLSPHPDQYLDFLSGAEPDEVYGL